MTTLLFRQFTQQPLGLSATPQSLLSFPHPVGHPAQSIVYSPLFVAEVHRGNIPTSELAFDRVCVMWEEDGPRVGTHLFPLEAEPFGLFVHAACAPSTQPPAPSSASVSLCSPHRSSPPARLTDRQMLSAMHLQLWASITLHKQPIARTQAANFSSASLPPDKGQYQ